MKRPSLRLRLLLSGAAGLLLVTVLASALLGHLFERSARDNLDAGLEQDLLTVLAQAEVDGSGNVVLREAPNDARFQRVFSGAYWQIADGNGTPLLQSRSLWDQSLALPAATPKARSVELEGPMAQPLRARLQQVRLPRANAPMQVAVAIDRSDMQQQVAQFRQRSALALAALVAAWLAVLASQVHFGLRPLQRLGRQVEQVRRGGAERIVTDDLGAEVAPLGEELNALLDHHQRMVERARTSAQDLAHALKTPLSVLATEADGEGTHWRQTLREQGTHMRASIDRYLAAGLARDHRQRVQVAPVLQSMCRLMQRVHGERGITFQPAADPSALNFAGAGDDLEEMLGNLLDNAGRWAAATVQVSAAEEDGQLRVDVRDDGPGLAAAALAKVTARGVRLDERESSSGLGLAIVGDIAASYGGRLALENAQPGLRATLWLPKG